MMVEREGLTDGYASFRMDGGMGRNEITRGGSQVERKQVVNM